MVAARELGPGARRSMDRRAFVAAVTATGIGLAVPGASPARTGTRLSRIGVQLYTVRTLLQRDFAGTLAAVARIGYREVEFAGYHEHPPQQIRQLLNRYGLASPAAHVPFESLETGWAAALEQARAVGHGFVVVPWIPPERRRSLDDWKRLAERLNEAGAAAHAVGLQLAYHNQSYEFTPLDGRQPYDLLLEATDAGLVQFEMDCYWISRGGGDPLDCFSRFPGRFPLVHVKDMTAAGEMADVGKGSIDWARLFARAGEAGIKHYFVEHDEPVQPLASIRASYAYLSSLRI